MKSYSPDDHIRHFNYESIHKCLSNLTWEDRRYDILDFGSPWFGDPDGGWQTFMRWIFKDILGNERINHILAEYPEYNAETLGNVPQDSMDIIVADQVFEHLEHPWWASEAIWRSLKPYGLAIVATPGLYPVHPSPKDCWRIMPDGYRVLFPDKLWDWLLFDTWGTADRVGWEYTNNKELLKGGRTYTVEEAVQQPYYEGSDGLCPMQLWWIGRKR